jgi:DNA mismatch repair protein MutS
MPAEPLNRPAHRSYVQSQDTSEPNPDLNQEPEASFRSILFDECGTWSEAEQVAAPEFFGDLNLDQIVRSIIAGREEYNLAPFFHFPLRSSNAAWYRQDVFRDLQIPELLQVVESFAESMRAMRAHLALSEKRYYKRQKQASFLDAVETYCNAAIALREGLVSAHLKSIGFHRLRDFLNRYSGSEDFTALVKETKRIRERLAKVRYSVHIQSARVTVDQNDTEGDYSQEVLATFEKFRQAEPRSHRFKAPGATEMNHIEAQILDLVAKLHPEIFADVDEYCSRFRSYCHELIATFDREVQFYIAYLEQMKRLQKTGLSFCHPSVTRESKEVRALGTYDLALANEMIRARKDLVTNSFYLNDPERIIVVSGPNQGGKTTFARTFGQLHYLGALGCPVPGTAAKLFLFDRIFTHFEKEEDLQNLRGKLEDELIRINEILERATENSILIMNESFLSTTLSDALFLSREVMKRIAALNMLCVTVTFLDELASFDETTVSMISTVNPDDPQQRTFKLIRKPADGLAYAAAIAEKYHLTYEAVRERISAKHTEGSQS